MIPQLPFGTPQKSKLCLLIPIYLLSEIKIIKKTVNSECETADQRRDTQIKADFCSQGF